PCTPGHRQHNGKQGARPTHVHAAQPTANRVTLPYPGRSGVRRALASPRPEGRALRGRPEVAVGRPPRVTIWLPATTGPRRLRRSRATAAAIPSDKVSKQPPASCDRLTTDSGRVHRATEAMPGPTART